MKDLYGKEIPQSEIDSYELDRINFEAKCLERMPYLKDIVKDLIASLERAGKNFDFNAEKYEVVINAKQKIKEYSEWEMMRSCDAPNRPGYYRANND